MFSDYIFHTGEKLSSLYSKLLSSLHIYLFIPTNEDNNLLYRRTIMSVLLSLSHTIIYYIRKKNDYG